MDNFIVTNGDASRESIKTVNRVDLDETARVEPSHLDLHCLQKILSLSTRSKGLISLCLFVCVEVLRPSQPNRVMSSAVSLPNHTFTGQA